MRSDGSRRSRGLAALALAVMALGGCTEIERAMASVKTLNFMHDSPFFDPHEAPRPAPPLSVPVASPAGHWEPPVERTDAALQAWGDTLTNPFDMSQDVLLAGAYTFQTYCAVCHGTTAVGDGPLVGLGKLPFATNLLLPVTEARTDGYIYALVRVGRGLMPSYQRIPPRDRWAVVNYVRYLQQDGQPIPVQLPGTVQPGLDQFNTAGAAGAGVDGGDTDTAGQE